MKISNKEKPCSVCGLIDDKKVHFVNKYGDYLCWRHERQFRIKGYFFESNMIQFFENKVAK